MRLVLFTLFTMLVGCSTSQGPDVVLLESNTYASCFDAAITVANSQNLNPVLLDRRGGVITTEPAIAGSFAEPWKPRPSSPRQGLENTLALQRRSARFEFSPVMAGVNQQQSGGELNGPNLLSGTGDDLTTYVGPIELRVWVYVDRKYTQGIRRGTWSLQSETVSRVLPTKEPWEQVPGSFWASRTRDIAMERALLAEIELLLQGNE